jgi:hypothetical protein
MPSAKSLPTFGREIASNSERRFLLRVFRRVQKWVEIVARRTYMKRVLFTILAGGLLGSASLALAQGAASPQASPQNDGMAQQGTAPQIAPGSVIPVQLTKSIDAKKTKSGDEVVAQVTQDMKTNSGEVIVPKGTRVVGHVTEVQARSKEQKESEVGIAFDHAMLKNGSEMHMPASIQAIIAPQNANPNANGGGNDQPGGLSGGGSPSSAAGGRSAGMGGSAASPAASNMPSSSDASANAQTGSSAHGPISANTQGIVGISDLNLTSAASKPSQGSLVSSEKNNVKLESGTLMLLRVNQ